MLDEMIQSPAAPAMSPRLGPGSPDKGGVLPRTNGDEPASKKLGGLVLTRHVDESIMVGDEVEVQVVGLKSGTVRLKIVAPRSIPVHRREVFDAIRETRLEVASSIASTDPRPGKPSGGLVLTRYAQQSIMIGDEVEIAVVEVRPTTVKLKIVAPRTVAVHRREVYEAIRGGGA